MTRDFTKCPKCGRIMEQHSYKVPRARWNGQNVCSKCEDILLSLDDEGKERKINGINS